MTEKRQLNQEQGGAFPAEGWAHAKVLWWECNLTFEKAQVIRTNEGNEVVEVDRVIT